MLLPVAYFLLLIFFQLFMLQSLQNFLTLNEEYSVSTKKTAPTTFWHRVIKSQLNGIVILVIYEIIASLTIEILI